MKTKIAAIILFAAMLARSQPWYVDYTTLRTNQTSSAAVITIVGYVTNASYTVTNSASVQVGEPLAYAFAKINSNTVWLIQADVTNANNWASLLSQFLTTNAFFNAVMITNSKAANGINFTNLNGANINADTINSNKLDAATRAMLGGSGGGSATLPTNIVLQSRQIVTYQTNYAYWAASNYLARVNGIVDWVVWGGDDAGNPPGRIPVSLRGSYDGTTGWFDLTNGFTTTNDITVVLVTNGLSSFGNPQVNPGAATLFSVDHWELYGATNNFDYQVLRVHTSPTNVADVVNKGYADSLFANAFNQNFSSYSSNSTYHTVYLYQNSTFLDISGTTVLAPLTNTYATNYIASGDTFVPTNFVFQTAQTNLVNGFTVQSSTNLALVAGFSVWTSYTVSTNAGTVTFTTSLNPSEDARYFRVVNSSSGGVQFNVPVTFAAGSTSQNERFGEVTISNLATTTTITFSTPFPAGASNYVVLLTSSGFATFPSAMYSERTTNGFTANTASVAGGGKLSYFAKW